VSVAVGESLVINGVEATVRELRDCPDCTGKAAPSGAVSELDQYVAILDQLLGMNSMFTDAKRLRDFVVGLQQRRPTEEMQRALLAGRAALLREEDDFREEYTAHRNAVSKERADECAAHAAILEAMAGKL